MTAAYSEEAKQAAVQGLRDGKSILELHETTGISLERLARWARSLSRGGQIRSSGGGRKPVLDDAGLQSLAEIIGNQRQMTLDELVVALAAATGKTVSKPTIAKAMKVLGYRKVKLPKAPSVPAPQSAPRYGPEHRRTPEAGKYPSSLTDSEWAVIDPLLSASRDKRGRKPRHDRRLMADAIFYIARTGCQWRQLPLDLPPWPAVWSVFRRLRDTGALERLYDAMHTLWREASKRAPHPTAGIVDSQSARTTEKGGPTATTRARRSRGANDIWSLTSLDSPAQS